MRGHLPKALVAAALAAAVCVPAASAKRSSQLKLALVPLQYAQLGAAGRHLRLQHDSGPVSNVMAAANATGVVSPKRLAQLGRLTGYQLDYGNAFLAGHRVRRIETGMERYRSATAARHGLAFWRRDEVRKPPFGLGVRMTAKALHAPRVGSARWAYARVLTIPGASPIYIVDEEARDGEFVLSVSVAAGSPGPARKLATKLAQKVDSRLRAGRAGQLRGKPAKLLPHRRPGPPASGPDPAKAALAGSDFTQATLSSEHYAPNLDALSEYDVAFAPADGFDSLLQKIVALSTPAESTYDAALLAGYVETLPSRAPGGSSVTVTPVDVSSVGGAAYGALIRYTVAGQAIYEGAVVLTNGPLVELLVGAAQTPLGDGDVTSLAQAAAAKLNAVVGG